MRKITLKDIRLDKGLKAYKVAEKLGVSKRQLIRIEKGEISNIEKYKYKLAFIYQVPVEVILNAWEVTYGKFRI